MSSGSSRWHNRWDTRARALGGLALAALALRARPAVADCAEPEPAIVWSYPAQGATNVPTNIDLWLLLSGWDGPPKVWRGGERLPALDLANGFDLGELAPRTEHMLRIESASGDDFELTFTTGDGPADPDPSVAPGEVEASSSTEFSASDLCQGALRAQDCFDTGQDTYYVFTPSAEAVGWVIEADAGYLPAHLWPGECGAPRLFGSGNNAPCVTLRAIDASGAVHAGEQICGSATDSTAPPNEGCGLGSAPGAGRALPLGALGLAMALGCRRARSGRKRRA